MKSRKQVHSEVLWVTLKDGRQGQVSKRPIETYFFEGGYMHGVIIQNDQIETVHRIEGGNVMPYRPRRLY